MNASNFPIKRSLLTLLAVAFATVVGAWAYITFIGSQSISADKFEGKFVTDCNKIEMSGIFYRDVLDLQPTSKTQLSAAYIKVFFSDEQCTAAHQIIQMKLPKGTWTLVEPEKPVANDPKIGRILVQLPAGKIEGVVKNQERAGVTDQSIVIKNLSSKKALFEIDRAVAALTTKELRLVEGDKLYSQDDSAPLDKQGFPTKITKEGFFSRF